MKTVLKIELFNDGLYQYMRIFKDMANKEHPGLGDCLVGNGLPRPWVARITGLDPKWKYAREFLCPTWDYSEANSIGSRGIHLYYYLDNGQVYEVKEQVTWKRWARYFCEVKDGRIIEITEMDVISWLKDHSA